MFELLVDKTINLTRGDTAHMNLVLYSDKNKKTKYVLQEGDIVKFSIKKTKDDDAPLVEKIFTSDKIKIESSDTAQLQFGKYIYDVQVTFANGDINTVIKSSPFNVCGEVSSNG